MRKFKLFGAALAIAAMAAPSVLAEESNLVFRGVMQDWYTYDKNNDTGKTEWHQVSPGYVDPNTGKVFSNQGLFEVALDPTSAKADKFVGMDFVFRHNVCYGNAGSVFTGNALYTFFFHETQESQESTEYVDESQYEILVRKWNIATATYETVGKLANSATDLTYDPVNDKVYGIFRIHEGEAGEEDYWYELCELDMNTFQVRQISHCQFDYFYEPRAIAINSKGEIYGINQRGIVMKFDKETGDCKEIGNIGFRTQDKMMSAAFDWRTDKLYWLGYKNDGKKDPAVTDGTNNTLTIAEGGRDTGLFEINTETGVATLLSNCEQVNIDIEAAKITKFGKICLTGLWVEGGYEFKDNDLKIDILSVPTELKAGEQVNVKFRVKNLGKESIGEDDWSVALYEGEKAVGKKSGRDLEPGETRDVTFQYTAPAEAGKVSLSAAIICDKDEEVRNNATSAITVNVTGGVAGDVNGDGTVNASDITALINKILGTADPNDSDCDINGDGTVNSSDITALINLILG